MGSCSSIIRPRQAGLSDLPVSPVYTHEVLIQIKKKDLTSASQYCDPVSILLTNPCQIQSSIISLNHLEVWGSLCTLPGIDPRGHFFKRCQDGCLLLHNTDSILLALFDGHGSEGEKVSAFCLAYIEKAYKTAYPVSIKDSTMNPESFLMTLPVNCDWELQKDTNINSENSGTTGVFILITPTEIFSASVGDSRAILAQKAPTKPLIFQSICDEDIKILEIKSTKLCRSSFNIFPLQLTKDQKPEDPKELERIESTGGRVKKLIDDDGNKVGPYRVWGKYVNSPGLSMSRSIGDVVAKKLGVISEPILTRHEIDLKNDLFVVVGSDGIWDAIDNEGVANFVEYFRSKTCKEVGKRERNVDITVENSSIAQLLCEEARNRWLKIIQEEDVMIDDISCIVLELAFKKDQRNSMSPLKKKKPISPITGDCLRMPTIKIKHKNSSI